jgi:proline iminopeptidase
MEALGDDRVVIRYDQLGGGKADPLTDTTKMTIDHFVKELEALRASLGYDKVHILGHSWGTILGFEYYKAYPQHVASLTLASAALDIPAGEKNAQRLVTTLSDSSQKAIKAGEAEKKFETPAYQAAIGEFYGKYVWRHPVEADLDSTMKTMNATIYNYMQGPSEFTIVGTLKKYDATSELKSIKVPTLFTVGEFDEANPDIIKRHASMTPGAKVEVIPGAAHITTWDNPPAMVSAVRAFLRHVDSTSTARTTP